MSVENVDRHQPPEWSQGHSHPGPDLVSQVLQEVGATSLGNSSKAIKLLCAIYILDKENNAMLRQLTNSRNDTASKIRGLDIDLPCTSVSDSISLNSLMKDSTMIRNAADFVGNVGGHDVRTTTYKALSKLMSMPLAKELNWLGKGKKLSVKKNLPCIEHLISTFVRDVHLNATNEAIVDSIQRWLKKAPYAKNSLEWHSCILLFQFF